MKMVDEIRGEIKSYLARRGMSRTAFGKTVMNDARFVHRLDEPGADIKASTIDKVREVTGNETHRRTVGRQR